MIKLDKYQAAVGDFRNLTFLDVFKESGEVVKLLAREMTDDVRMDIGYRLGHILRIVAVEASELGLSLSEIASMDAEEVRIRRKLYANQGKEDGSRSEVTV